MPDVPQTVRTPGYPFFMAVIYFLFGERYSPLIIVQIIISLGTIVVTYLIAATTWQSKAAIISALLLSLDLPSFVISQKIMTETLFTFVLSITIITGLYALKDLSHVVLWIFLHGMLLSLVTLIRPVAYYAFSPVIITFITIWKISFGWRWKKIISMGMLIVAPWLVLVGGWQLRNYLFTGSAKFTSKQWEHLLFHFGAHIIAQRDGISFKEARYQRLGYRRYTELHPETKGWPTAQLGQRWKREGLSLIRQHPWLFLKVWILRGFLPMLLDPGEHEFRTYVGESTGPGRDFFELPFNEFIRKWVIDKTGFLVLYCIITSYIVLFYASIVFSVWQAICARRKFRPVWNGKTEGKWEAHILIWVFIVYFVLVSAGVNSRFRIPIMPLFSIYAGYGMYQIVTRKFHKSNHGT